jgi:hypothetical protein
MSHEVIQAYVSDRPWRFGFFHWAHDGGGYVPSSHFGFAACIGPCKCGDPTHSFPAYHSLTPCVYVRGFGHVLTCRLPRLVLDALLYFQGPSDV